MARLVVLGWDSATFEVVDPLIERGSLPVLASLQGRGVRAPLRSTWPPMTDCAWTSAFTGRNPGAHGIFGSWYRAPGEYACRYFSARDRKAPALWELADGVRFLVWNVPMTFPPAPVEGAMVAGYGAPPGATFCEPGEFQSWLEGRARLDDLSDRAPHGSLEGFLGDLVRGLETQAKVLPAAIRETRADCCVAVWPQVDRAQHFFWRFRGTDHVLADAVDRVYAAMDAATGAVIEAFPDADVLVVSDHGAGDLKADVNLAAVLAERGLATYGRSGRSALSRAAWALPPGLRRSARRLLPGVARRAMADFLVGQLGPFEWGQTRAFFGVHGDLWVNAKGREPAGTVAPGDVEVLLDEIEETLGSVRDPRDGSAVVGGFHRRDDIYSGPAVDLAPDALVDLWSTGYRVAPRRETREVFVERAPLAGVNEAWSSDHRPVGMFVAAGPHIAAGELGELHLFDLCPTALALLGAPVPDGLDGRVATEVISRSFLESNPVRRAGAAGQRAAGGDYSEEEAAAVAAHLKDLGYIE